MLFHYACVIFGMYVLCKNVCKNVYVVARVESGLELSQLNSDSTLAPKFEARVESLNSSLKLGANVESSEKLIIRVKFFTKRNLTKRNLT